jgi:hypothetical protein
MKPVIKNKLARSTKAAGKLSATNRTIAKKPTGPGVGAFSTSGAPLKNKRLPVAQAATNALLGRRRPSVHVTVSDIAPTSPALLEAEIALRRTLVRPDRVVSNRQMQDLPDSLEAFSGWTKDPTDEEVEALISAREYFSYDHSSE